MLTIYDINKWTYRTSFEKGLDLYKRDLVIHQEYLRAEGESVDFINAQVKGSGRNIYQVLIDYAYNRVELVNSSCDCPAYENYDGLCKHCVAVLLKYMDSGFESKGNSDLDDLTYEEYIQEATRYINPDKSLYNRTHGSYVAMPRQTSIQVKELFRFSSGNDLKPILNSNLRDKVRLEATLHCKYDGMTVTFSIGSSKMYKVKSVIELGRNIKLKKYFSYGKNLAFRHSLNAFEEEVRPMVKYIGDNHMDFSDSYLYSYSSRKEMPLEAVKIVEFLRTLGEKEIYVELDGQEGYYAVTDEDVPREMTIRGYEDGIGIQVDLLVGYTTGNHNIYFYHNKVYINTIKDMGLLKDFLGLANEYEGEEIFVANEDIKDFCNYLLPVLEESYKISKIDFDERNYASKEASFEIYMDKPEWNKVVCRVIAVYGDSKINIFSSEKRSIRDDLAEYKVNQLVSAFFNDYDETSCELILKDNEELLYDLVSRGFTKMKNIGEVFVTEAFRKMKVTSIAKIKVGLSLKSDLLELDLSGEEVDMKHLREVLEAYRPKKRYHRLKNGDFIDVSSHEIQALHNLLQALNISGSQLEERGISLPKFRAMFIDDQLKKNHSLSFDRDQQFKSLIRNMKTIEDKEVEIPKSLAAILREYQKIGFAWLKTLYKNGFGGILADDMGTGKSLQVITFLKSQLEDGEVKKALIVCPSSLVYNWKNEFSKFAPELIVTTVTGKPKERENIIKSADKGHVLITSYDLVKRDMAYYKDSIFGYQIIDEAQYIKNHSTQAAKAVKGIRAGFKIALTGTPIENRLSELWSIFDYLMPGFLYSYKQFRKTMEIPIVSLKDEKATKRLSSMISPFVLRRLKVDVLSDLPDKLEENIIVAISGNQEKLYNAHLAKIKDGLNKQSEEEFRASKIKVLAELTRLRQVCCDPGLIYEDYSDVSAKVEVCMDLIAEAVDGGHKVLLFSQFTSMFPILQDHMRKSGLSYYSLTGKTSKEKRIKLVEAFNRDETSVFCISLKAGGTGLNLTAADIVIHFDPWWNAAVESQASARAHRIGQKNMVNIYKLIVKNSVEEKIVKIQEAKKELSDKMLSGEKISVGSFTKEELMEILG